MQVQSLHSANFIMDLPCIISMITKASLRSYSTFALTTPQSSSEKGKGHHLLIFSYNKSIVQHIVPCLHHLHPTENTASVQDPDFFDPLIRAHHPPTSPIRQGLGRKYKFLKQHFSNPVFVIFMPTNGCHLRIWMRSKTVTACHVTKLNLEVCCPNSQSAVGSLVFLIGFPEPISTTIIRLLWDSGFFLNTQTKLICWVKKLQCPPLQQENPGWISSCYLGAEVFFYQRLLWRENMLNQR